MRKVAFLSCFLAMSAAFAQELPAPDDTPLVESLGDGNVKMNKAAVDKIMQALTDSGDENKALVDKLNLANKKAAEGWSTEVVVIVAITTFAVGAVAAGAVVAFVKK